MQVYNKTYMLWHRSKTRQCLELLLRDILLTQLENTAFVKKVLCFGLGDFCRSSPEWLKRKPDSESWELEGNSEVEHVISCMIQHSMATTLAQLCEVYETLPILAQDPDYSAATEEILTKEGFKVVGTHGAGGFAEIDNESIIISPFTTAPVKQIIADLARPVLIISTGFEVFNDNE
ncbi:hypothetical protein N7540_004411 [Penicillium herquei]|nr:hypothetical protein N7540_004411 [Penicillium herquei]